MKRRIAAVSALVLAALAGLAQPAAAGDKVRVAIFPLATALPYWVADQRGYFKDQNIDVEPSILMGSQQIVAAMITNQIDATTNLVTGDAINVLSKKPDLLYYISLNCQNAAHPLDAVLVRKGLDVSSIADLKGKGSRIMTAPGAGNVTAMREILKMNGMQEGSDFTITELAPGLQLNAVRAGSFDAFLVFEPLATMMQQAGVATFLEKGVVATYEAGRREGCGFGAGGAVTQRFVNEHPDVARRYAIAWRHALDDVNKDPTTRELLKGNTATPPDLVQKIAMPQMIMVGDMTADDRRDMQAVAEFNFKTGIVPAEIDTSKYLRALDK